MDGIRSLLSSGGFMPHIHCYLAQPGIVWTMFVTDMLIGTAYVVIAATLWGLVRRINLPFNLVVLCFGVFIAACGGTHFMEVWTLWYPDYWWAAGLKLVTAIASVGTGIYLYQLRQPIHSVAEAARLSEQRRLDLEALTRNLEQRVDERTHRLQLALDATNLGTWDLDLQTRSLSGDDVLARMLGYPPGAFRAGYDDLAGRVDPEDRDRVARSLEQAIRAREDFDAELRIRLPDAAIRWISAKGRASYASDGAQLRM